MANGSTGKAAGVDFLYNAYALMNPNAGMASATPAADPTLSAINAATTLLAPSTIHG